MKLSAELIVVSRIGRWVAIAGASVAAVGIALNQLDVGPPVGLIMMQLGGVAVAFGVGVHLVAGDEEEIPPAVKSVLDEIDSTGNGRPR